MNFPGTANGLLVESPEPGFIVIFLKKTKYYKNEKSGAFKVAQQRWTEIPIPVPRIRNSDDFERFFTSVPQLWKLNSDFVNFKIPLQSTSFTQPLRLHLLFA